MRARRYCSTLLLLGSVSLLFTACPDDAPPGDIGGSDISSDLHADIANDTDVGNIPDGSDTAVDSGQADGDADTSSHLCEADEECTDLPGKACFEAVCLDGACDFAPAQAGADCAGWDLCTENTACDGLGACVGTPIDCDDGNPCTLDTCDDDEGCFHVSTPKEACDDGDTCTQTDTCDDAGACVGTPVACDDGDPCTVDSCVQGGCEAEANPACAPLIEEGFACEGPAGAWEFVVLEGDITWAVDDTPNPPAAYGDGCSLNFNDGVGSYGSADGQASFGQTISPIIDASSVPAGAPLFLSFYNYWQTDDGPNGNYDQRGVEVSADGFETATSFNAGHMPENEEQWFPHVIDLGAFVGTTFQVRFFLDTQDSILNEGVGWFIDDFRVGSTPPDLPPEACADGKDNDFDLAVDCDDVDCAFDAACTTLGDTCETAIALNASNFPAVANGHTADYKPHYGYGEGACPGESGGWGGGVGTGAPDVVYALTPSTDDEYLITVEGPGFDANLYVVTDCGAINTTCLAGADNVLVGEKESLIVELQAGTTYFIIVDGWSPTDATNAGPFELVVDLAPEFECNDAVDNDENGLTDCEDPGCVASPFCLPEGNCFDGADNDGDGLADCDDDDCTDDCDEASHCDDGIDNDGNGLADCDDAACADVCKPEKCKNNIDDDGDGLVDCNDPDCLAKNACKGVGDTCDKPIVLNEETLPLTFPGNTADYTPDYGYGAGACPGEEGGWGGSAGQGSPDMVFQFTAPEAAHYRFEAAAEYDANLYVVSDCGAIDASCLGASESPGLAPEILHLTMTSGQTVFIIVDGWQNNSGNIKGPFQLSVAVAGESDCDDGVDNDANGATDCGDAACALSFQCLSETSCTNGKDDDGDGQIDCADAECASACDESIHCDDGVDNDGDGAIDCQDPDCAGTLACVPEDCFDATDNDGDGNIDCADTECAAEPSCLPPGDTCEKPIVINALPFVFDADTCDATDTLQTQAGGGCFIGGQGLPDHVYSYTPAASGSITFGVSSAGGNSPQLLLNVATECLETVNDCLGGANPMGGAPSVTVDLVAGQTYTILVDGFSPFFQPTCGSYTLSVTGVFQEAGYCGDGIDNDEDGATDCADSECEGDPLCGCSSDADCPNADACSVGHCDAQTKECQTSALDCNDGDICTEDGCNVVTGCLHQPAVCDDGVDCTVDFCTAGVGCGSAINPPACDDNSVCTTEVCDATLGCVTSQVDCNDGVPCTSDTCDAESGCIQTAKDADCDDGKPCTDDVCDQAAGCLNTVLAGCEGASCASAIPVGALPFTTQGDTSAFGDTNAYGPGACVVASTTSLAFDGVGSHATLEAGDAFDFSAAEGITLSFWIKVPVGFANPGMIVVQGPTSWYMTINGFQALSWRPVAPVTATTGNGALIEGVWSHVVATYDNLTYEAVLYVDGIVAGINTGSGPLTFAAGWDTHVGRNWSDVAPLPFTGKLDELSLFDRALSEEEVDELGSWSDLAPINLGPKHWWRLGEGDVFPSLEDMGSDPSSGTVHGGAADDFTLDTPLQPGAGAGSGDILYTFTPPADGVYEAILDSQFAATIYVAETCGEPSASCVAMSIASPGKPGRLSFEGTAGEAITMIVDGQDGDAGAYTLTVDVAD